jgi:adenylate cyclase
VKTGAGSTTLRLSSIREALEGVIPPVIATCAPDGTPNVSYLSEIQFIDEAHVALSFQFFNKTRANVLANPRATVRVNHPVTAIQYELAVEYLRTETEGPLFERMKAKLAGIASQTGMSGVFRLRGADVYRVHALRQIPGRALPPAVPRVNLLTALRGASRRIADCCDIWALPDTVLEALDRHFAIAHSMVALLDERRDRLFVVASRGYPDSGIGAEIPLGAGVIGVAARERTPIRITHFTTDYAYTRAVRESMRATDPAAIEEAIPLPGLKQPRSQLAVPTVLDDALLGVLYVESEEDGRFGYDDEDALMTLAAQIAVHVRGLQLLADQPEPRAEPAAPAQARPAPSAEGPLRIRYYRENDSVFLGDDYLIKGVAGAIFRKLVRDYVSEGRTDFTNRELRLDPSIRLPELSENLEARLILLQRRLAERSPHLAIEKTGRGRFRLCVGRPIELSEAQR